MIPGVRKPKDGPIPLEMESFGFSVLIPGCAGARVLAIAGECLR